MRILASARVVSICAVGLSILLVVVSGSTAAASASWTVRGTALLAGTFANTAFMPDGTVRLSSWTASSDRTIVLDVGPAGTADAIYARSPFVLKDSDGTYKMWYSGYDGGRNRMLYATSADGTSWTKHGVVIDDLTPPYYFDSVGAASVVKTGSTYQMWLHGGFWSGGPFGFTGQIYHANSDDGVNWTITGVALTPNQPWDIGQLNNPKVIQDSNGVFWMFFSGWDGTNTRLGVATSVNGTSFVPYAGNPILPLGDPGTWDSQNMPVASVILNGSHWTMWYGGWNGNDEIGVAHSADGFNWTKDASNPVFVPEPSPSWDDVGVGYPDVLLDGTSLRLYFGGFNGTNLRIGMAYLTPSMPIPSLGAYETPVFDSNQTGTTWNSLAAQGVLPTNTTLALGVRVGDDAAPDSSWSRWEVVANSSLSANLNTAASRYIQVIALFLSEQAGVSPVLASITVLYTTSSPPSAPTPTAGATPTVPPTLDVMVMGLAAAAVGGGVGAFGAVVVPILRRRS